MITKNPYSPGVGTRPPYLAGREQQLRRFERLLADYPEKRRNLRITGLRGVGKTVLLKEYERIARHHGWVVLRRDWSVRLCEETDFAIAIADYLREAVDALSLKAKVRNQVTAAMQTVGQIQVQLTEGVTVSVGPGAVGPV
ncbi:MAG TPA: ATP-binding protein, partial [Coriobacteriia bacterium]|nr:ATP-binding protein [Coriobacteriia bacterium]